MSVCPPEPPSSRLAAPADDLITLAEAVRRMKMRRAAAVAWLRREGLVVQVGRAQRVLWADVRARLRALADAARPRRAPVRRYNRTDMGG